MRRRLQLANSHVDSGGYVFYCDLYIFHPLNGSQFVRTATFPIDGDITWEEADGLVDIDERSQISLIPLPNSNVVISIDNLWKEDGGITFAIDEAISVTDKIIIGKTYRFSN